MGLAAWLLGIQTPQQLALHPFRSALMETWVVGEILKARCNRGLMPNVAFWRDRSGHEVDLLIDHGDQVAPVAVKAGQTIAADMLAGLDKWREIAGGSAGTGWLVYGGEQRQARGGDEVLPWRSLGETDVVERLVEGRG